MKRWALAVMLLFPSTLAADPIKIGWSGPLTGNSAVLGVDSLQAARLAVDQANASGGIDGQPVELAVEDDQYDTAKAVSSYGRLVSQGVAAIVASTYGGVFATDRRALRDGVIVIDPLDCNNDIAALGENTFCIATESESIGRILAREIRVRAQVPAAVIYDEKNPFMTLVQEVIRAELPGRSSDLFLPIDQGSADFRSVLTKLRAADPQALVLLGHDPMGQAMREARGLGLTAQFYTLGTITSPGYQKLAGHAAEGALVAYWSAPSGKLRDGFIKSFEQRAGRPPILELAAVPTYDVMTILIQALKHCAGRRTSGAECLRNELLGLKGFAAVSGELTMDADGAVRSIQESIYEFRSERLVRTAPRREDVRRGMPEK